MTTLDSPPAVPADDGRPEPPPELGRRRQPAPSANPFWRFVFPVLVVAAGIGVFLLWRAGTKAILDSPDGRVIDLVTDPAEPGYEVFVSPTPTLLVVHLDQDELVGVTALARTALDAGGSMVVMTADLSVPVERDGEATAVLLHQAYADGGLDEVQQVVEGLFGFGFLEVAEIETEQFGGLMGLVEPLDFSLAGDLVVVGDDGAVTEWLGRGDLQLSGEVAAQVYGFRNPGEADANRVQRQLDLWRSWLEEINQADNLVAATLPFDDGLAPYLRSLGAGTADIVDLPVAPVLFDPASRPIYVLGEEGEQWMVERGFEMVPLPVSPRGTVRPSVRLLDGTGDSESRDRALPILVEAGVVISVIGNAESFDIATTTVVHHRAEGAQTAAVLAAELGGSVVFDEDVEEPVDFTITIGSDLEAG